MSSAIVEWIGAPGVGKSTQVCHVVSQLRSLGFVVVERDDLQRAVSSRLRRQPPHIRIAAWVRATLVNPTPTLALSIAAAATRNTIAMRAAYSGSRQIAQRHTPECDFVVLDQDLLQIVLGIGLFLDDIELWVPLMIEAMAEQLPDILVSLSEPDEVSLERLRQRRARVGPTGPIDEGGYVNAATIPKYHRLQSLISNSCRAQGVSVLEVRCSQTDEVMRQLGIVEGYASSV